MKLTFGLLIEIGLIGFCVGSIVTDLGKVENSYIITWHYVLYTIVIFIMPFVLGYFHGKKQN